MRMPGPPSWLFDDMNGTFEARLRRTTMTTRTSKGDGREITVSNTIAIIETKFNYDTLDRLYYPSFVGLERQVTGSTSYVIFEVVSVNPTHYQMLGMDVSMPTLLRREYLDTINESWGKSQETWIDLAAIPTWYITKFEDGDVKFDHTRLVPLAGARVHLLSKKAVQKFLCYEDGESAGDMIGFDLPLRMRMENLIRFHAGLFGFSVDHDEPIMYRQDGVVRLRKIGDLVDEFYNGEKEGPVSTSSIEVVSFDQNSFEVKWSPLQYVFRHRFKGKLLKFRTRTGRSVAVTPAHSLFVLRDGKVRTVPASEISVGDFLVGSREVPENHGQNARFDLIQVFAREKGIHLTFESREQTPKIPGPSDRRSWYWKNRRSIPIEYLPVVPQAELREAKIGYKGCRYPLPTELEVDKEIAELLGYYVAEGHLSILEGEDYRVVFTLGSNDQQIIEDLTRLLRRKFGITPSVRPHGERGVRISFSHRLLAELLDWCVGRGAGNKRLPEIILNSPPDVRSAFLRAWVRGDYAVTVSESLMSGILYLLLMEGCVGTSSEWEYSSPPVIEGRAVRPSLRYQLKFPRADEILNQRIRSQRGRSEPIFPARALPKDLIRIYSHPSHIKKGNLRANDALISNIQARVETLLSYADSPAKRIDEARHDGFYRTNMGKYIRNESGTIRATSLLLSLREKIAQVVRIAASHLVFLEVLSVEEVDPSSQYVYDVSVPGRENFLAGFGGIFCHNTGSGKSNLAGSLIRKAMNSDRALTVIVFDVAGEYPVHLVDLLNSDGRIVSNETIENAEQFYNSQAIPESLEEQADATRIRGALEKIYRSGVVQKLSLQEGGGLDLAWISQLLERTVSDVKAGGTTAKIALEKLSAIFYGKRGLQPGTRISDLESDAKTELTALLREIYERSHEKSGLRSEVDQILNQLEAPGSAVEDVGPTPEKLAYELATGRSPRLTVLYLPEPTAARMAAGRLIDRLLYLRKKIGSRGRILVVLDEAQEYIPDNPTEKNYTLASNYAVEKLLRQGRKYRVHCWLATQRVAHLNVSALQQLHSYFVSTLPRTYDRMVVADSFALPYEVLERSAQLETGEWIFVSYKATKQKNVPVFLKTENNEDVVAEYLKSRKTD